MNVDIEFEEIKKLIVLVAEWQGVLKEDLIQDWSIDYKIDLNEEFNSIVKDLFQEMKLLTQAREKEDDLTALIAIIGAKVKSQSLMNFFIDIHDDIERLMWGDEFVGKWPSIPEEYKIPEDYDYKDTNKPYSEQIKF
ncbi:hypothetical protein [Ignatzschineria sp. LJL83]